MKEKLKRKSGGETWPQAKKRLIEEYREAGIERCESCGGDWAMSFHHLDRRSTGRAEHTFEGTRLLCCKCHHLADNAPGYRDFNEWLRTLR